MNIGGEPHDSKPKSAHSLPTQEPKKVDAVPAAPPPTVTQHQEVKERMTSFERSTVRWTRVTVGISILAAIFICAQWYEMHTGSVDTHKLAESADTQATQTTHLATAAGTQAKAASDFAQNAGDINTKIGQAESDFAKIAGNSTAAIKATQEAMRLDQRAWVAVADISGVPQAGQPFIIALHAKNSGRTFARNFRLTAIQESGVQGMKPHFDMEVVPSVTVNSISLLPPNGVYESKTVIMGEGSHPFVPNPGQEIVDRLKSGEIVVIAHGRMDYVDIFHRSHWTTYCFLLDSSMTWNNCHEHNEADDAQNPN